MAGYTPKEARKLIASYNRARLAMQDFDLWMMIETNEKIKERGDLSRWPN